MWIETERGTLVNLDHVEDIATDARRVIATPGDGQYCLAAFSSRAVALAAMDRLKKWLASDGGADDPDNMLPSRVFSFRTLSEDDEFNKEVPGE